jgi:sec-independent protein translocase protein TatC
MNNKADNSTIPDITMSLGDHLEELRVRIIYAVVGFGIAAAICMIFGKYLIAFIEVPYIKIMGDKAQLQSIDPAEGFMSYMEIAMIAALVISSPWIFYHLWKFVSVGLYPHEKKYVYIAVPMCSLLFAAGALLFIFVIAPATLQFFVYFNTEFLRVSSNFTFTNYISFMANMMLIFGLSFQTPIAIFVLIRTGIVSADTFKKYRIYVFLIVVVISSAVIPGSDPISLFAMAIPVYLLFELGLLLSWLSLRKAKSLESRDT